MNRQSERFCLLVVKIGEDKCVLARNCGIKDHDALNLVRTLINNVLVGVLHKHIDLAGVFATMHIVCTLNCGWLFVPDVFI